MRPAGYALVVLFVCALAPPAQAGHGFHGVVQITPEPPNSQQVVRITFRDFVCCFITDPVRNGNVFEMTYSHHVVDPPKLETFTFFVGPVEAGSYVLRVVSGAPPGAVLLERPFVVVAAPATAAPVPTLNEYALMFLAAALAVIALRRAI